MAAFRYQDNQLWCEDVPLAEIATAVGTPIYIYSQADLQERAVAFVTAVPSANTLVCYAVKANNNPAILGLLRQAGLGADVTSGGELFLALHAGISPDKIIYSGVGKRRDEIEMALDAGIRALHVESAMELEAIAAIAGERQQVARIGVRVNPDIHAETHPYMTTGEKWHKFGVTPETAVALLHTAREHPALHPIGLAAHIGSQITAVPPFVQSAHFLVQMADELATSGIRLEYVDVGGGLGIDYEDWRLGIGDPPQQSLVPNFQSPHIFEWVTAVTQPILAAGYGVVMEPGRSIVGPTGCLLTRVTYTKSQGGTQFAIVDAGMSDLIRPTLYDAYHPVLPVTRAAAEASPAPYTIVGPICETGDWLAKERSLPALKPGNVLAIMQAGAYGYAMASNYNGRLKPAEILVNGNRFTPIRKRQDYTHLLDGCQAPE
ncbi:MAG: diaminopimelate decarboxylase [Chloroflexi bacterium]|nr:diaminopimelate decarboxylase [Ardenticatenaceae bacterium]NOG35777.1 diaminopimelate decarboxylase [Chloroflexota bacterium]